MLQPSRNPKPYNRKWKTCVSSVGRAMRDIPDSPDIDSSGETGKTPSGPILLSRQKPETGIAVHPPVPRPVQSPSFNPPHTAHTTFFICFTLIIYKQFDFCRFRASAYTNVDRLCAVYLYNICCFHDFIETSAPIERQWITLIHYKNDVHTENCFKNDGCPPS